MRASVLVTLGVAACGSAAGIKPVGSRQVSLGTVYLMSDSPEL